MSTTTEEKKEHGDKTLGFKDVSDFGDQVHESAHPVLLHKITILRSSSTPPASFRAVLREVTYHLGYEATSSLTTRPVAITVPVGKEHVEASGHKLVERVSLIPILRSGLGMVDPLLELLPNAAIHHIGT
jgi:uracil phosphoribosyltransferase